MFGNLDELSELLTAVFSFVAAIAYVVALVSPALLGVELDQEAVTILAALAAPFLASVGLGSYARYKNKRNGG